MVCHRNGSSQLEDSTSRSPIGLISAETSRMIRQATIFLRYAMTIALALGVVLSSDARLVSHDVTDLAKIVAGHNADFKGSQDHGHDHEDKDIVDVMHAYLGHAHEMVDHDHNIAFLAPRHSTGFIAPARTSRSLTKIAMLDRRAFDLDRPPRA